MAAGGELGISSLRADSADTELLELLAQGGVRSVALAPEAGSDRLRPRPQQGPHPRRPGEAAVDVSRAGIRQLRLYFMVGLPTETLEDVAEIPRLAKFLSHSVIKASQGKQHLGLITLSISSSCQGLHPFPVGDVSGSGGIEKAPEAGGQGVPRDQGDAGPHRSPQMGIRPGPPGPGRPPGGGYCWWTPASAAGARPAAKAHEPGLFTLRATRADELFPWDFIDHGLKKDYLWEEYQRALEGKETPPCHPEICSRCGVCGGEGKD